MEQINAPIPFSEPPDHLCVFENSEATCEFLLNIRRASLLDPSGEPRVAKNLVKRFRNPKKLSRIRGTIADFSKIEKLSTATALVMTAEYDRAQQIIGETIPTINLHEWHEGVFSKLFEIGFFEAMKLTDDRVEKFHTADSVRTMRVISGNRAALAGVSAAIKELCAFFDGSSIDEDTLLPLRDSLSEAMINANRWAYPADHRFVYEHVGRWWVTASADRDNRILTVAIYDQGASIPVTYGKKPERWTSWLTKWLLKGSEKPLQFEYQRDGAYIADAVLPGKSQTGEPHHGNGLPEMKGLIDDCGAGSMRILSRGGLYEYEHGSEPKHSSRNHSIGGTLIEWKLEIPQRIQNA